MTGNATEEGLLRDLKNPAHRDRPVWPLVVALAMLVGGTWIVLLLADTPLPVWAQVPAAALLVGLAGAGTAWLIRRYQAGPGTARADTEDAARATREADMAVRIAAARASGAFDRWEARRSEKG